MLTGGLCALSAAALTNFSTLALDKGPMGKVFAGFAPLNAYWAQHPLLRILCEQPAIWTVPLSLGLMVVVSEGDGGVRAGRRADEDARPACPGKTRFETEYIQEHQSAGH